MEQRAGQEKAGARQSSRSSENNSLVLAPIDVNRTDPPRIEIYGALKLKVIAESSAPSSQTTHNPIVVAGAIVNVHFADVEIGVAIVP